MNPGPAIVGVGGATGSSAIPQTLTKRNCRGNPFSQSTLCILSGTLFGRSSGDPDADCNAFPDSDDTSPSSEGGMIKVSFERGTILVFSPVAASQGCPARPCRVPEFLLRSSPRLGAAREGSRATAGPMRPTTSFSMTRRSAR